MKKEQPELYNKLLQYQDKCADVLAAVFIDNKSVNDVNLNDIMEKLNKLENNQKRTTSYVRSLEKSPWLRKTLNDIGLLQIYLQILHKRNLLSEELTPKKNEITFSWTIHLIIKQAELIDNSVNFSDYKDMYEIQTKQVYSQVLNAIEYFDETRELFDKTLDLMLKELKELTEYKLN